MGGGTDTRALGGPADAYDRHVGRYGAQLASGRGAYAPRRIASSGGRTAR
jgi:hypothetical protein